MDLNSGIERTLFNILTRPHIAIQKNIVGYCTEPVYPKLIITNTLINNKVERFSI